jgi:hypothetical protein
MTDEKTTQDVDDSRIPPYDDRTTGPEDSNAPSRETVAKQLAETDAGNPGATTSPASERPVRDGEVTDREPESPKGVGSSENRSAEKVAKQDEAGRDDAGTKGATDRPVGTSTARDTTGVDADRD